MLLQLSGRGLRPLSDRSRGRFLGRITTNPASEHAPLEILRVSPDTTALAPGFRGYLFDDLRPQPELTDAFALAPYFRYLADGDVVRVIPELGELNVLYRRASKSNFLLVTERCDNYCVMCSQPPKERDDSWLVDDLAAAIPLMSPETRDIGITGGEPALLGPRLVELVQLLKQHLPSTGVHILSNGRRFAQVAFAETLARVRHPDLMMGIPLYSDLPEGHDFVVQANGAFDQTLQGILQLKAAGVRVEIRYVIHADTVARLPEFARFLARNLTFVDHVALMGLEPVGFARANLERIWVDPLDYSSELSEAVRILSRARLPTSIYNHPLCVLPASLHSFARKSISDWKNIYVEECSGCRLRDECGGFFASATTKRSRGIRAVTKL